MTNVIVAEKIRSYLTQSGKHPGQPAPFDTSFAKLRTTQDANLGQYSTFPANKYLVNGNEDYVYLWKAVLQL